MTQQDLRARTLRAGALLAAACSLPAAAQTTPAAPTAPAPTAPERRVVEDDHVRIEETRVRGQLQQVVVRPKVGEAGAYEIVVGRGGRDPSQDASAAGRRVWSVLRF